MNDESAITTTPTRVRIGQVEKEMAALWKKAAEGVLPGVSAPVARMLILNLLVYTASESDAERAGEVITRLSSDYPARVVIADTSPGKVEDKLNADVSMLCSITEYGRRICGEEVILHAHGMESAALGSILPLLAPDLPLYLWTPGDFDGTDGVLGELAAVADAWIIDSSKLNDPHDGLSSVLEMSKKRSSAFALHDLTWARLAQWREAVAQHFDQHAAREYLTGVRRIEIVSGGNAPSRPDIGSVLLAAWLMERLRMSQPHIQKGMEGSWAIHTTLEGHPVYISFSQEAGAGIKGVLVESELDGKSGSFKAQMIDEQGSVVLKSDADGVPDLSRTVIMPMPSDAQAVGSVLDMLGWDRLYEKVLPVALNLMNGVDGWI